MYTKEHQKLLDKYKKENKPTNSEIQLEDILKQLNIKYIAQKGFIAKAHTCYIADFYLPKPYKTIIEVDGSSHKNREIYDAFRDKFFLEQRGIKTIRILNEELYNPDKVKAKLILKLNLLGNIC